MSSLSDMPNAWLASLFGQLDAEDQWRLAATSAWWRTFSAPYITSLHLTTKFFEDKPWEELEEQRRKVAPSSLHFWIRVNKLPSLSTVHVRTASEYAESDGLEFVLYMNKGIQHVCVGCKPPKRAFIRVCCFHKLYDGVLALLRLPPGCAVAFDDYSTVSLAERVLYAVGKLCTNLQMLDPPDELMLQLDVEKLRHVREIGFVYCTEQPPDLSRIKAACASAGIAFDLLVDNNYREKRSLNGHSWFQFY